MNAFKAMFINKHLFMLINKNFSLGKSVTAFSALQLKNSAMGRQGQNEERSVNKQANKTIMKTYTGNTVFSIFLCVFLFSVQPK